MNNEKTLTHFPAPAPIKQRLAKREKALFLRQQNQCSVCGKALLTDIEYIPFTRFMVEKAKCTGCHHLNRVKNHSLQ